MRKNIQINIPKPCHENWDQMTPVDKGRFCDSCQKQVVDFTNMSDEQLVLFFKNRTPIQSREGSVCGRFMQDQLDRTIDIPKKRIPWIKYFFQFLLPGFLMSCGAKTIGKIKVNESKNEVVTNSISYQTMGVIMTEIETMELPDTGHFEETVVETQSVEMGTLTIIDTSTVEIIPAACDLSQTVIGRFSEDMAIKGKVVDINGQPIPHASVFVKGTTLGVGTDSAGNFSFTYSGTEDSTVLIGSCIGYQNTEYMARLTNSEAEITITLDTENLLLGEVVVASSHNTRPGHIVTGAASVNKKMNIIDTICSKIFPAEQSFKLYPNPLKNGTPLAIEMSKAKAGTYLLQLSVVNGQIVLTKEMWVDKNNLGTRIDIPPVAAGTYLVSMINKKSGKTTTEKIIVE